MVDFRWINTVIIYSIIAHKSSKTSQIEGFSFNAYQIRLNWPPDVVNMGLVSAIIQLSNPRHPDHGRKPGQPECGHFIGQIGKLVPRGGIRGFQIEP
jgi:hypothetical protein